MRPTDDWRSKDLFDVSQILKLIDDSCLEGDTQCAIPYQEFPANTRANGVTPGSHNVAGCNKWWDKAQGGCAWMGKTTCRIRVEGIFHNAQMLAALKAALKGVIPMAYRDSQEKFHHCTFWVKMFDDTDGCETYADGVHHSLPQKIGVTYFVPSLEPGSPALSGYLNYELECTNPVALKQGCPGWVNWASQLATMLVAFIPGASMATSAPGVMCSLANNLLAETSGR
jgi:hypothetical protein